MERHSMRWLAAAGTALAFLIVSTVGSLSATTDTTYALRSITEGRWGAIVSASMAFLFVSLVWPEVRGWYDDRTNRKEQPRGEGMLNISVCPVTNFGSIHVNEPVGHAWFFTDEIVIANHTKNRMLIRSSLVVGLKSTSNYGASLELYPNDGPVPPTVSFGNNVPLLPRLVALEPKGYVSGRLAFRLHRGDVQQRFGGSLDAHMTGDVRSRYFDVFSEKERVAGWGSRLRRL